MVGNVDDDGLADGLLLVADVGPACEVDGAPARHRLRAKVPLRLRLTAHTRRSVQQIISQLPTSSRR